MTARCRAGRRRGRRRRRRWRSSGTPTPGGDCQGDHDPRAGTPICGPDGDHRVARSSSWAAVERLRHRRLPTAATVLRSAHPPATSVSPPVTAISIRTAGAITTVAPRREKPRAVAPPRLICVPRERVRLRHRHHRASAGRSGRPPRRRTTRAPSEEPEPLPRWDAARSPPAVHDRREWPQPRVMTGHPPACADGRRRALVTAAALGRPMALAAEVRALRSCPDAG